MMPLTRSLHRIAIATAILGLAACGDSETAPAADDHTPVSYTVLLDGSTAAAPFTLTEGQTVRVRLEFVNAAGENLDAVEAEHFARVTFTPPSLATVSLVADHHFQFDVIGASPGTGTLQVGFGHDALADETAFPAVAVTVQPAP
jgi:hypothetical protein